MGLGVGTGGAFALLPAQNATGNWIKVVQRVPVRIALDPKELAEHPLRVGLSTEVAVDVANTRAIGRCAARQRDVHDHRLQPRTEEADALVKRTIAENLGRSPTGAANAPVAQ